MDLQIKKVRLMFFFYSFIFINLILLYSSYPLALYQVQKKNLLPISKQMEPILSLLQPLNAAQIRIEKNKVVYHLNQDHFGASDYEKAQQELQQFNRPLIGIVGQDSDWVSYQEYQKKILTTIY